MVHRPAPRHRPIRSDTGSSRLLVTGGGRTDPRSAVDTPMHSVAMVGVAVHADGPAGLQVLCI
jgi:hypothetical protein